MALTPSVSSAPRQLSDSNGVGTLLGAATNPNTANGLDLIGFFGGGTSGAITQPSGGNLAPINQNTQMNQIVNISGFLTAAGVAANTTAEQLFTLTPLNTTDIVLINKPTLQAGLGVASCRVSATNQIGVTYVNVTAGSITPTSEQYSVYAVPAQWVITQALTPTAVPAQTTVEQQFTVPGLVAGQFVQVNKPAAQAGLAVMTSRVIANNLLGITYINATASPITPSAAENYIILGTSTISMRNNLLSYGSTITATGSVAINTTAEQALPVAGILATDVCIGVSKPTAQAGLGIVGQRVSSAGTISVTYVNDTGATITPTSELNTFAVIRRTAQPILLVGTQTLAPTSVSANTTAEQTFTLTSPLNVVPASATAFVNKPSLQAGLSIGNVRVTGANTIGITFVNNTAAAIVPATEAYTIAVATNAQGTQPAAIAYEADIVFQKLVNQMSAYQAALGPAGLNLLGAS